MTFTELRERVVLVTGGTRGIGRGIAEAFLGVGANVVVCARNQPDYEKSDVAHPTFLAADLRDPDQASALVVDVVDRLGRIDVLINNVGGSPPSETATASPRFFEAIVRLNLLVPLMMSELGNEMMQKQATGGSIINIASLSGLRPSPGTAAYGAAKAGLINATESLSVVYAAKRTGELRHAGGHCHPRSASPLRGRRLLRRRCRHDTHGSNGTADGCGQRVPVFWPRMRPSSSPDPTYWCMGEETARLP